MARRVPDRSPKFIRDKNYAIGTLKLDKGASEVPEGFSRQPPPIYLAGSDLLQAGLKTCRDFLISANNHFKNGAVVHFYEVEYHDDAEPTYKNIFSGTPLLVQETLPQMAPTATLSDGKVAPTITNIIPGYQTSEHEKMLFKSQDEAIKYYQKCLQDERKQFNDERVIYTQKQQELNDKILELNIQINSLRAEAEALRIKYEEARKYTEELKELFKTMSEKEKDDEEETKPQGLADKTVGMLDGLMGEGASMQIVMGLANGLGSGISKLIELGIDKFSKNGVNNASPMMSPQAQIPAQPMSQVPQEQAQPPQALADISSEQLQFLQQLQNVN